MHHIAAQEEFPGTFMPTMGKAKAGWTNISQDLYTHLATFMVSKIRVLDAVFEKIDLHGDDLYFKILPEADEEWRKSQMGSPAVPKSATIVPIIFPLWNRRYSSEEGRRQ